MNKLTFSVKNTYQHEKYSGVKNYHVYTFSKPLTQDEFVAFAKKEHRSYKFEKNSSTAAWYEDYEDITGNGTNWEIKHIEPYVD